MILKIMTFKKGNHTDGKSGEGIHEHASTELIQGLKIQWCDVKALDDKMFTRFTVDENKPTERDRMISFDLINQRLVSAYVLNDSGKTIQKPI